MIPGLKSYRKVQWSWPFFSFFVNNFWKNCAQNFKLRTDQAMPFNCCLTENHLKYDNLRMLTRPPFTRNWHISKWGEVGHPKNWRQLYCFKWQLIRRQFHCIIQKIWICVCLCDRSHLPQLCTKNQVFVLILTALTLPVSKKTVYKYL